jgi:hypothetical protein
MKSLAMLLTFLLLFAACGETTTETASNREAEASPASPASAPEPATPAAVSDPCAPLEAAMTRYQTAGKPFRFSFEIPRGFTVNELHADETSAADVTWNAGESDEFVLRLIQTTKRIDNTDRLVEGWKKFAYTEKVLDKEVSGRTMHVHRTKMGELVGFNALFPDFGSAQGMNMVMGGVTSAPQPCRESAADMVEKMILSFERNEQVGENRGG